MAHGWRWTSVGRQVLDISGSTILDGVIEDGGTGNDVIQDVGWLLIALRSRAIVL